MSDQSNNFEALVKAYVSAEADRSIQHSKLEDFIRHNPETPNQFNSLEEANKFQAMLGDWENVREAIKDKEIEYRNQVVALGKQILNLLNVPNTWVKAGDYAVGFYYDTWGGGHYELEIRKWSEDLPKLTDKTYYP